MMPRDGRFDGSAHSWDITGVRQVAAALGVAPRSLYRSIRTDYTRERFREVQVVTAASPSAAVAPVVIMTAEGLRVEGLDLDARSARPARPSAPPDRSLR